MLCVCKDYHTCFCFEILEILPDLAAVFVLLRLAFVETVSHLPVLKQHLLVKNLQFTHVSVSLAPV